MIISSQRLLKAQLRLLGGHKKLETWLFTQIQYEATYPVNPQFHQSCAAIVRSVLVNFDLKRSFHLKDNHHHSPKVLPTLNFHQYFIFFIIYQRKYFCQFRNLEVTQIHGF